MSKIIYVAGTQETTDNLSKLVSTQHTSLDASGYEVDIALMQIMGAL